VTGALFAADSAYRWYSDAAPQMAAPVTGEPPAETAAQAPAETAISLSPGGDAAQTSDQQTAATGTSMPANPIVNVPVAPAPAPSTVAAAPELPTSNPVNAGPDILPRSADVAAPQSRPPLPPRRPETANTRARQATRERAAPRRPVRAAERPPVRAENRDEQPNVYWERDSGSQLGFAPQLRRKTCDPTTGQMPMQCYYPREGRERFPAKPLN
jgi:hypothetical protein